MSSITTKKRALWQTRIEQWSQSKKSIKVWCRENNIVQSTFHYWKNHFSLPPPTKHKTSQLAFVELKEEENCPKEAPQQYCIEYLGIRLYIEGSFNEKDLLHFLQIARRFSC